MALVEDFGRDLSRPEQKFLRDLVLGILCGRSCLVSEIARAIAKPKDLRTVYDRLDINLGKYDLNRAYVRAQKEMLSKFEENFLLIFDPSEIAKPYGKKMEGLAKIRDASEQPRLVWDRQQNKFKRAPVLKPGYPLRIAIGLAPNGDVIPLELSLYSAASEDFISGNDESLQAITSLLMRARTAPLLVLDREFDAYVIIRNLCELNFKFVIRIKSNRKYRLPGASSAPNSLTYTREEITENNAFLETKAAVTYTWKGLTETKLFEFKAARVQLLAEYKKEQAIRAPDDLDLLTLIRMRIYKDEGVPTLYLLSNTRPNTAEELERLGKAYIARWNIEEYIRFLKQHFKLEGFLVRDLGRMKNLMKAVYIATVIIHVLTDRNSARGSKTHHLLVENSLEVRTPKKTRDFFLYAYGRGLAAIVAQNKALLNHINIGPEQSDDSLRNQLSFLTLE